MKLYECQSSRSFIDLDSIFLKFFSSVTTRPIYAKFHVYRPWDGRTEVYSNGLGHITKTAVMPIYGKDIKKNLLLWNQTAE